MKNIWLVILIGAACGGLALTTDAGIVTNPSFEDGFFSWTAAGQGWRIAGGDDAHTGLTGVVNDVQTTDVDEWRVLSQEAPITAGASYNGGVWVKAVDIEDAWAYLEIQFFNSAGEMVAQHQSTLITGSGDYTKLEIGTVDALNGAVTAGVRAVTRMVSEPTANSDYFYFDDFEFHRLPSGCVFVVK